VNQNFIMSGQPAKAVRLRDVLILPTVDADPDTAWWD
jgi:hypothetical protein